MVACASTSCRQAQTGAAVADVVEQLMQHEPDSPPLHRSVAEHLPVEADWYRFISNW